MRDATHLCGPFRKRLDAFAHELRRVEEGDIEALHRTRVASRRLREVLPLLQLDLDPARKLTRRLRKVTKQLGNVRELDVLTLLIQELAESGRCSPTVLRRLGATAEHARAAARERLSTKLPTAKLERLALKLERVSKGLESDNLKPGHRRASGPGRAWLSALEARVARRAALVRAAIETAGAVYAPEPLHRARIALKKLRYAAELAAEAGRRRTTADTVALKAAQDLLGRLHDLEVLLVRVGGAGSVVPTPSHCVARSQRARSRGRRRLPTVARALHARSYRAAIANRMGAARRVSRPASRRAAG